MANLFFLYPLLFLCAYAEDCINGRVPNTNLTCRVIVHQPTPSTVRIDVGLTTKKPKLTRRTKYGMAPPFLIGACSVLVAYTVIHCIYLHCYTKEEDKNKSTARPAIFISEASDQSGAYNTPVVHYDTEDGVTEVIKPPFLLVPTSSNAISLENIHPALSREGSFRQLGTPLSRQSSLRRTSSFKGDILQRTRSVTTRMKESLKRKGSQRHSVCSESAVELENLGDLGTKPRASICFMPLNGHSNTETATPLLGYTLYVPNSNELATGSTPRLSASSSSPSDVRRSVSDDSAAATMQFPGNSLHPSDATRMPLLHTCETTRNDVCSPTFDRRDNTLSSFSASKHTEVEVKINIDPS